MKRMVFSSAIVCLLLVGGSNALLAQGVSEPAQPVIQPTKIGVGFQSTWPAYGISGMLDLTDQIAVQGIVGFLGSLNTYAGRGVYRFSQEELWSLYGYGMTGAWTYEGVGLTDDFQIRSTTETVLGFGAGAGIEYDWRALSPGLPPIFWNLEAGLGMVNFNQVNYNFSTFMIGGGAHFRF